jgi:hypothetical protein
MHRLWIRHQGISIALLGIFLAGQNSIAGEGDSDSAGVRVFYTGHSFHMFVPSRIEQLVKSAGIEGHKLVGTQGIGGSRVIQHWDLVREKNKAIHALESGQVDVFTMAAHLEVPDPGIDHFTELGLKHNRQIRMLVQASWMLFDQSTTGKRIRANEERNDIDLDDLETATTTWRKKLETQADRLNSTHGRRAVFIVPVGDAVNRLRRLIVAGNYPNVTQQSELFRDPIGHGLGQVQALAAYCNFVAIYSKNPEGLQLNEPGVNESQHAILQRIAWETVSQYSYAR